MLLFSTEHNCSYELNATDNFRVSVTYYVMKNWLRWRRKKTSRSRNEYLLLRLIILLLFFYDDLCKPIAVNVVPIFLIIIFFFPPVLWKYHNFDRRIVQSALKEGVRIVGR